VTARDRPGAPARPETIAVNAPLTIDGYKIFLLGNGYVPVITVRDAKGEVLTSDPVTFLPGGDANYTSNGVVQVRSAAPEQLALEGIFLPTAASVDGGMPQSVFPDLLNPALVFTAYAGELGQSTPFRLDRRELEQLRSPDGEPFRALLVPGRSVQLPQGRGSVTLERVERFAGLSVRHDPGRVWALGAAIAAMSGLALSLFVPRRRVFVRVAPSAPSGVGAQPRARTLVQVGALARTEDTGLAREVEQVLRTAGVSGSATGTSDDRPNSTRTDTGTATEGRP
jgi:cytochrome c biogenesis protein